MGNDRENGSMRERTRDGRVKGVGGSYEAETRKGTKTVADP